MASESTPLIQTVQVAPPRQRYPHQTCRRFFTIACSCVLICGLVTLGIQLSRLDAPQLRHGQHSQYAASVNHGKHLSYEELLEILIDTPDTEKLEEWSRYYTAGPHLAGQNLSQAEWTRDKWESWGIQSSIVPYEIYVNYPDDHSLTLLTKEDGAKSWDVAFEASLTEDEIDEDPTSLLKDRIPTFHGYSASGNVTAPFVYVNSGTYQDYQDLVDAGIKLEGKIAIAQYGGVFRGLKVKRAQELGMVGVLIYDDPGNDGEITEENGYETYPKGPARNPSAVQRGSVEFLSTRPGDPTTPGYASKPGVPRSPGDDVLPSIPSIPISYTDALPLLKALNGHGPKADDFNKFWSSGQGLKYKGVEYNIGPSPKNVVVNIYNSQRYVTTPQWDVIGVVNGTIPTEVIVIGNHRDAWIAGGAGDPNSGSAALNEVARAVGIALSKGWKPLRTIIFASWDGEEYGLLSSTEWVEEFLPWLTEVNVAYINTDVAAVGPVFSAGAAPLLHNVIRKAAFTVQSPNQTVQGQTVGDVWSGIIAPLGSGSDYTAFQDFAGVPSLNIEFTRSADSPIYQYHSNYDSFHWMSKFGDPGFRYHRAIAQLLGVVLAELSEEIVIPFRATDYADALDGYLDRINKRLSTGLMSSSNNDNGEPLTHEEEINILRAVALSDDVKGSRDALEESLAALGLAIGEFRDRAAKLDTAAEQAREDLRNGIPWWNVVRKIKLGLKILKVNLQYKKLERYFLYEGGLDNRNWFKHVVYAPGLWTGYSGAQFPGLVESLDLKNYENGLRWAGIIKTCVQNAMLSIS